MPGAEQRWSRLDWERIAPTDFQSRAMQLAIIAELLLPESIRGFLLAELGLAAAARELLCRPTK